MSLPAMSLGLRFFGGGQGEVGGSGWVHLKGANCMAMLRLTCRKPWLALEGPFLAFMAHFSATQDWHFPRALIESLLIVGVVRVTYMIKMAEISSGKSLNPNTPREPKLRYFLWLQRLKRTSGK